ncbi:hypothetical protein [Streptomyces sp. WAC04114]|nr:hypothetical protein [Streptomyces sp. WAC04114]
MTSTNAHAAGRTPEVISTNAHAAGRTPKVISTNAQGLIPTRVDG